MMRLMLRYRCRSSKGDGQYYIRIKDNGKSTEVALRDSEGQRVTDALLARAEFKRLNGLAKRGINPFTYDKTLATWLEEFLRDEELSKSKATAKNQKDLLIPAIAWFADQGIRTPQQMTPANIEDRMFFRLGSRKIIACSKKVHPSGRTLSEQRVSERTVNLERAYLAMLFEYIIKRLPPGPGAIEVNPIQSVKARREKRRGKKPLSEEHIWKLIEYFDNPTMVRGKPSPANGPTYSIALRLAIESGLRPAELAALRWEDIDFPNQLLWVRNSEFHTVKDKEDRIVPLENDILGMLRAMQKDEGFVFATTQGENIQNAFRLAIQAACRKLGLHMIHPYQLRHTFATRALNGGSPIQEVASILGHSKITTTQKYAHASDQGKRLAVRAAVLKKH